MFCLNNYLANNFEEHQAGLLECLKNIAESADAVRTDVRRRSDTITISKSVDGVVQEMKDKGFEIKRSAVATCCQVLGCKIVILRFIRDSSRDIGILLKENGTCRQSM